MATRDTSASRENTAPREGAAQQDAPPPVTIKKYANRRLYNTATSSYVTLDNLCQMVKEGTNFVVYDAKTGEDITRSVLTQIIVEEESKGQNLLPISVLRQLISLYGDNLQFMVPRYLEHAMESFARNQDQMRQYFKDAMSGMFPFGTLEEVSKQNMAMFERAMQMFSPFGATQGKNRPSAEHPQAQPQAPGPVASMDELKRKLDELQTQLEALNKGQRRPD